MWKVLSKVDEEATLARGDELFFGSEFIEKRRSICPMAKLSNLRSSLRAERQRRQNTAMNMLA